tara:strand:+ start:63 stop:1307 length:1245 start_codon:yes stop_codon:yes gene_type:complete
MSNSIFNLNNDFDFTILNLGNPTLINNNNYSSKLSHGNNKNNLYIQFPKCRTKQGIVKNSTKTYTELNFNLADKNVIDFFEKLEHFCTEQIYNNRELWFYDSHDMKKEDIDELILSTMKPYKHGRNFLIKTYVKLDKLIIYDENENKINYDDFDNESEFIPLVNINSIKFTTKNFSIEMILSQIMIIHPADEFEKQFLIKLNNSDNIKNKKNKEKENLENQENLENIENKETIENVENIETIENIVNIEKIENLEKIENKINEEYCEEKQDKKCIDNKNNIENNQYNDGKENPIILDNIETIENNNLNNEKIFNEPLAKNNDNEFNYLINSDLEKVELNVLSKNISNQNDESINLKSHEEIYLEIYKTALKKAKEIRNNAITAFLEAKKIKNTYNLDSLELDTSDDDEDFVNMS